MARICPPTHACNDNKVTVIHPLLQEDVDHEESYFDGPLNSKLPEGWQAYNPAAASTAGRSNGIAGPQLLQRQESQVAGLTVQSGLEASLAGEQGKVCS